MSLAFSTLDTVVVGQESKIISIAGGDVSTRRRLMELGVLPGTMVKILRVAPLGDPIEVCLRGYSLSIRKNEAAAIGVELSSNS